MVVDTGWIRQRKCRSLYVGGRQTEKRGEKRKAHLPVAQVLGHLPHAPVAVGAREQGQRHALALQVDELQHRERVGQRDELGGHDLVGAGVLDLVFGGRWGGGGVVVVIWGV